jgi:hypothetical protein
VSKLSENRSKAWFWLFLMALLIGGGLWGYWRNFPPGETLPAETSLDGRFETSIRAASFLENIQYGQAETLYAELLKQSPDEPAYLRNAAIAALANVKYQMDLSQDPKNDVESIRGMLPDLFDKSAAAIERYRQSRPDDPIAYQLDALRDARWIAILSAANPIIADEEQAKLLEKLKSYVERFPANAFLVTQFNNSAEVMSAVDPKILEQTVAPLRRVHESNPRNIYLLCLLIQRLVQLKDPSALELVEPLASLLEPFEWKWKMERRPKDLSDLRRAKVLGKTDVEAAMGVLIGWVGEAKSTEGSLVDAKSIDISELAFLDLSDVQRMLQTRSLENQPMAAPKFQVKPLEVAEAVGVKFFDWNVDTRPELLVWTDRGLKLGEVDSTRGWNELAELPLPFAISGLMTVDLFAVDAHRGISARSDVSGVQAALDAATREAQIAGALRHETLRDILVYGREGVAIVAFEVPVETVPHWSLVAEDVGLGDLRNVTAATAIDWESDGDLDLVFVSDGKLELRENMGNRQFRNVNSVSMLPPVGTVVLATAVVDFDRDVDLDVLVSHAGGFGVLENIQHGQFRYKALDDSWASLGAAGSLAIGDFNNNYSWDVVAGKQAIEGASPATATGSGVQLVSTTTQLGKGVAAPLTLSLWERAAYVAAVDWNNDAQLDMVSASEDGVTVWLNRGGLMFSAVPLIGEAVPGEATRIGGSEPQGAVRYWQNLSVADLGNDGWLDVVALIGGQVSLVSTQPVPDHHHLAYRIKGISDANGGGRNNQYAVGATVEIFGPFGYQARVIEEDSVHFGLGADRAYSLRTIFVNGLTQGIIDPKSDSMLEEKQVLIGSCPFAYGWDGASWQLITDLLWNAPLGLQIAKGKVLPDRRWEHLMLPRKWMQPYENGYELRITEELWESAYFDHVALMAIDHPAELEILSNEKVGPPSMAEPKLWGYRETIAPQSVRDGKDRDWTVACSSEDGVYAIPFDRHWKQGLVETSMLEIDFGTIDLQRPSQLILTGWIYPTDTSLNIGIGQNSDLAPPAPPSLATIGPSGQFETVVPFMGFPGGKPKTIVIPLDGLFPTDDHRIRLSHSSRIYWDRVRLGYGESIPYSGSNSGSVSGSVSGSASEPRQAVVHPRLRGRWLPMQSAELRYRGFSRELPRSMHQPHWYDYQVVTEQPAWPTLGGAFTRLGDVRDMLMTDDDWLVVMGAGDEMRVRFEIPAEPVPEGWVRDFVLHSVGWDKDAAMNTLEGQSSLPLPFSRMSQYPPGAEDREESRRIEQLHRSTLTRKQSLERFWKPTLEAGARQ